LKNEINTEVELRRAKEYATEYRTRLASVSWNMKKLFPNVFSAVGTAEKLKKYAKKSKCKWTLGIKLKPALKWLNKSTKPTYRFSLRPPNSDKTQQNLLKTHESHIFQFEYR